MNLAICEMNQKVTTEHTQRDNNMSNQSMNTNIARPRIGEQDIPITFRTNRFFTIGSDWYFSTREGKDKGPFANKEVAQAAITKFIREVSL